MNRRTANFKRGRTSKRLSVEPQGSKTAAKSTSDSSEDSDSGDDSELFNLGTGTLERMRAALRGETTVKRKGTDNSAGFFVDKDPSNQNEVVVERKDDDIIALTGIDKKDESKPDNSKRRQKGKRGQWDLSSSLQVHMNEGDVYVHTNMFKDGKPSKSQKMKNKKQEDELMKQSVLTGEAEKQHTLPPYSESFNQLKKQRKAEREKTKGKDWFNLPATELTEEKKNDLMVLQYRRALDPKRFYKAPDIRAIPKYFQMGRVVDNPVDFYHSRIPKKERKKTLVDELLADQEFRQFNKRKYAEIQESKMRGRKGAFKHMKRLKKKKK